MKAKLDFEPVLHWTNPLTFPGWTEHSRGAGGVKGGYAAAQAVKTLDAVLTASAHSSNIRGMSHFPFADVRREPRGVFWRKPPVRKPLFQPPRG